jgi:hypothetical protein
VPSLPPLRQAGANVACASRGWLCSFLRALFQRIQALAVLGGRIFSCSADPGVFSLRRISGVMVLDAFARDDTQEGVARRIATGDCWRRTHRGRALARHLIDASLPVATRQTNVSCVWPDPVIEPRCFE